MEYVPLFILGIVCCALGAVNTTGNLSTIKYRQRYRVAPENRKVYGMLVGIGTIIIGIAFIVTGILVVLAEKHANPALEIAGGITTIVGAVVGLALNLFAIIKYNKGLF